MSDMITIRVRRKTDRSEVAEVKLPTNPPPTVGALLAALRDRHNYIPTAVFVEPPKPYPLAELEAPLKVIWTDHRSKKRQFYAKNVKDLYSSKGGKSLGVKVAADEMEATNECNVCCRSSLGVEKQKHNRFSFDFDGKDRIA